MTIAVAKHQYDLGSVFINNRQVNDSIYAIGKQ